MDHGADSFSQYLNTKFQVSSESVDPVELELVGVTVRQSEPNEQAGMERFSIFFYGPASSFLPQQTYELVHQKMGAMHLFIVPVANDERGIKYEAVFNRFNPSTDYTDNTD